MNNKSRLIILFFAFAASFFWQPAMWMVAVVLAFEMVERGWKQLLDAIRGRHSSSRESIQGDWELEQQRALDQEFQRQQEEDRVIEAALQQSQYKHIPGRPWGDPGSYVSEQASQELLEQQQKKLEDEKREQETREFLNSWGERILKEHEAVQKPGRETGAKQIRWLH
ncbi:MAG: hypothetical protein WBL50_18510 [Candidatus Acidiferrum sp.]